MQPCIDGVMGRLLSNSIFLRELYLTGSHAAYFDQLGRFKRLRCFATSDVCGCALTVAVKALAVCGGVDVDFFFWALLEFAAPEKHKNKKPT